MSARRRLGPAKEAMPNRCRLRIALIKAVPAPWELEANWRLFHALATTAADRGAQLIIAPECFLDGYAASDKKRFSRRRFERMSQPLRGDGYVLRARALAKELGAHLLFCFTQKTPAGCYNAAALMDPAGRLIGVYHKTHLLDHDRRFLPGRAIKVYDTALGRLGIMICADRRWPEVARALRLRGAQLILNPSYGMCHLDNEWWMRTRSYENETTIAFAHPRVAFIADPRGAIGAKLESNLPDVLVHDLDLDDAPNVMLAARRPRLYVK